MERTPNTAFVSIEVNCTNLTIQDSEARKVALDAEFAAARVDLDDQINFVVKLLKDTRGQ